MSKTDLAEVLKVSLSTINRRLKNGKLPPHANIGDRVLFPTEGVAVFLTQMSGCHLADAGGEL
ncbi:MAG: helix-turn-helix domain-containing protein [Campylobacterales bacterium]|nr:helix-turn-helix domain-containing protein [Campylobacterales bacterium]